MDHCLLIKALNSEIYLDELEIAIRPLITEPVKNQLDWYGNTFLDKTRVHFYQDGAPLHNDLPVIGRRGPLEYTISSDLSPSVFFL